jgi:aminoglycoside phosphotransferase family enzyme/predicted kinase
MAVPRLPPLNETAAQEPIFALLSDPATHEGAAVKRIDTHAASVFLAGRRAFKIKRAVRFPFLDYSTLEKRRRACEAEVAINRPSAPSIYRGVVPITRTADGGLELNGTGTPVEWAVEMERFDESATLDHLAERGRIDAALAEALGRAVAAMHATSAAVVAGPWIAALGQYIEEHDAAFRQTPDLFVSDAMAQLTDASRAAYGRIRSLLMQRGERGLVRRIHGDLHLGNIVLIDGRPVVFDAIEFNELIASGDLLYDLAFLLMDLCERGLFAAANIVFNRYLIETARLEDLDALSALPLFLSMRAAIRARVTVERRRQAPSPDQSALAGSACNYFALACRAIRPKQPAAIAVAGLSGTGKSVLARTLAPDLEPLPGAVIIRSDVERKHLAGVAEHARLPQAAYEPAVSRVVFERMAEKAHRVLAAGHSIVLDSVFAKPEERLLMEKAARTAGIPLRGFFLTADLTTRMARVTGRSADVSDADAAVARLQESYDLGVLTWERIDACGSPEQTLARTRGALAQCMRTPG